MSFRHTLSRKRGFGSGADYSAFASDGALKMSGNATVWDDIQISITLARVPAANAPEWTTWNFGVGSGVAFAVLGFSVNEYLDFYVQSAHRMKIGTVLKNHIHYSVPTDAVGKKFQFQVDAVAAGVNSQFAVPTGSPFTAEKTLPAAESGFHRIFSVADIPGSANTTVSTLYVCRLKRIAASVPGDEYASDVYVLFTDSHYEADDLGSSEEYTK